MSDPEHQERKLIKPLEKNSEEIFREPLEDIIRKHKNISNDQPLPPELLEIVDQCAKSFKERLDQFNREHPYDEDEPSTS